MHLSAIIALAVSSASIVNAAGLCDGQPDGTIVCPILNANTFVLCYQGAATDYTQTIKCSDKSLTCCASAQNCVYDGECKDTVGAPLLLNGNNSGAAKTRPALELEELETVETREVEVGQTLLPQLQLLLLPLLSQVNLPPLLKKQVLPAQEVLVQGLVALLSTPQLLLQDRTSMPRRHVKANRIITGAVPMPFSLLIVELRDSSWLMSSAVNKA
ncbi:hypothetical protein BDR26DRAFT_521869 [Obelidium mucronatum]|nr:hypothetical protein BDR26DRAFT_521869 [Obelidium mucronatum]